MRLLACLTAALFLTPFVAFAGDQDFTLVNSTGYQIDKVFVSPVGQSSWGPDIMGRDTLDVDGTAQITFHNSTTTCQWDLKVDYHDGDTASWGKLNLCDISKVTLFWNRQSQESTATVE